MNSSTFDISDPTDMPTTSASPETSDQKRARLEQQRAERMKQRKQKLDERSLLRLELAERFEQERGPEGSDFAIYDSGQPDDPLVVVARPLLVQWTKYEQTKQTPTDRFDFVTPSVLYPEREAYLALREKRVGVELGCSNLMGAMMGIQAQDEAGK